jgi:hypothetical protein
MEEKTDARKLVEPPDKNTQGGHVPLPPPPKKTPEKQHENLPNKK